VSLIGLEKAVSRLALFADGRGRCAFQAKRCAEPACPNKYDADKISVVIWTVCVALVVEDVCGVVACQALIGSFTPARQAIFCAFNAHLVSPVVKVKLLTSALFLCVQVSMLCSLAFYAYGRLP
jgi:hypothetical protein